MGESKEEKILDLKCISIIRIENEYKSKEYFVEWIKVRSKKT